MATITQAPIPVIPNNNVGSIIDVALTPIRWIFSNLLGIIGLSILGGTIAVGFMIYYSQLEEKKEQEDMMYKEYKNSIRTSKKNQDDKMYTSKYSLINLIWLGIPLVRPKFGRKIFDKRSRFIGYYDGMFTDMLGNHNILVWKDKSFFFFRNHFLLRVPTKSYMLREPKQSTNDKKSNKSLEGERLGVSWVDLPTNLVIFNIADKTISVQMLNLYKHDYYYYPVFEDDHGRILDLTESINAMNHINSSNNLLTEVIKQAGKSVIGMTKVNTQLVYEQRQPEKVKEIEDHD